ncbi:hypothetical protein GGR56DRAFT_623612 [Xylariaceae sp. FL0804]|nr:hypothetical protein GGR56DRAFT_623612 [Xylariaceae sp. FL0804]
MAKRRRALDPALVCAENIAALSLLHTIPDQPHRNSRDPAQHRGEYTLDLETERRLAGLIAFLAHTDGDPNRIPAVCVQEAPERGGLDVFLAVNRAGANARLVLLQDLEFKFGHLFSCLAHADTTANVRTRVFHGIVSMCSERILRRLRLRLRRSRKPSKTTIEARLEKAMGFLESMENAPINQLALLSFLEKGKSVSRLLNACSGDQAESRLGEIVTGFHQLSEVPDFEKIIQLVPDPSIFQDNDERAFLVRTIRKVAEYYEAARWLYRAAKKRSVVRRMKIMPVRLDEAMFEKSSSESYKPTLQAVFSKSNTPQSNMNTVCRLLEVDVAQAERSFISQVTKTLAESKIHAEIQLVYHIFELNPSPRPPRAVVSSKEACWLCHEFIRMHGRLHVPGCHGRLYPGWRLPNLTALRGRGTGEGQSLAKQFNEHLRSRLAESLRVLVDSKSRKIFPEPQESQVSLIPRSDSTMHILPERKRESVSPGLGDVEDLDTVFGQDLQQRDHGQRSELAEKRGNLDLENDRSPSPDSEQDQSLGCENKSCDDTPPLDTPCIPTTEIIPVPIGCRNRFQGDSAPIQTSELRLGQRSPLYGTGGLEVQVEYGDSNSNFRNCEKTLRFSIEQLSANEAARIRELGTVTVFDAVGLRGEEVSCTPEGDGGYVYIAARGTVLRVWGRRSENVT